MDRGAEAGRAARVRELQPSEPVHSISFICRIIGVFLFAAQGRTNGECTRAQGPAAASSRELSSLPSRPSPDETTVHRLGASSLSTKVVWDA